MVKAMLAAISVLMLLAPALGLGGTSTGEAQDSDPSCLLQKKAADQVITQDEVGQQNICPQGQMCECTSNTGPPQDPVTFQFQEIRDPTEFTLADCAAFCDGKPGFVYRTTNLGARQCWCCDALDTAVVTPNNYWTAYEVYSLEASSDVEGDPHIKTLDGRHYTLLKQGTFSLWHFSGVDAESHGQVNKVPVDWHIYAHYSGSQSFTKGLLLVDKSGGSNQVLEFTSRDCEWRTRSSKNDWTAVSDGPISVPSAGTEILVSKKSGTKGHNHVRLNLKTQKGKTEVAVLSLSCRPHHSLNLQLVMKNRADNRFVDGELQMGRRDFSKLSMMQTSTSGDSEFAIHDSWQSLGGSEQAALYLEMDKGQAEPMALLSTPCTSEAENEAKKMCTKHLGDHGNDREQTIFQDCVYDVCHGADETVAELAAELRDSTRAI